MIVARPGIQGLGGSNYWRNLVLSGSPCILVRQLNALARSREYTCTMTKIGGMTVRSEKIYKKFLINPYHYTFYIYSTKSLYSLSNFGIFCQWRVQNEYSTLSSCLRVLWGSRNTPAHCMQARFKFVLTLFDIGHPKTEHTLLMILLTLLQTFWQVKFIKTLQTLITHILRPNVTRLVLYCR